ncbi:hypothetical protein niasHS_001645 [Heterodera schachtii]|uniref:Threonylcarbamoyl-AMP synthase n=1 Tax=Heterodera schachtii TaxID=97005 RepID=A0ABD2KEU4_HETSC
MIRGFFKQYDKNLVAKFNSLKNKALRVAMPGSNIRKLDTNSISGWSIVVDIAFNALMKGQVVAVPTDTLYGLVALAEHSDKLYKIKRRSVQKPLGLFLDRPESIKKYCDQTVPDEFLHLIYPGPVTLLFNRTDAVPSDFNPGCSTVGVRVPQAKFVRDLCRRMPFRLLAQTSANVSGGPNPLCIRDFEEIWDDIDLIVDAGEIIENNGADEGSTVVDLSVPGQYKMIRQGCAPIETIHLLREFGLRSTDEIQRERLVEAGKGLKMLEIEACEIAREDESVEREGEGKDAREGDNRATENERDIGRKEAKEEERVAEEEEENNRRKEGKREEREEEKDTGRKQQQKAN